MKSYQEIQAEEARTWLIEDPVARAEKAQRERARYPLLARQMGLHHIDTSRMEVWDIGAGPLGGVSSVIPCFGRMCFDPLKEQYKKYYPMDKYSGEPAEELREKLEVPDLIIITNALDHFQDPCNFLTDLAIYMKPGAYFAHLHSINNAYTHPHEAHEHSLTPEFIHDRLDQDFETVWELVYPELRYGWVPYQGKVGQPAFCGLFRKTTGYK
jgi:hypothetical protein